MKTVTPEQSGYVQIYVQMIKLIKHINVRSKIAKGIWSGNPAAAEGGFDDKKKMVLFDFNFNTRTIYVCEYRL